VSHEADERTRREGHEEFSHEGHDDHEGIGPEGHEGREESISQEAPRTVRAAQMRVGSSLSDELERVVHETIGCCLAVHRELGAGLLESTYRNALAIELEHCHLSFELERHVPVRYRGRLIAHHRVDLIVEERIIVEVKAIERIAPVCVSQVMNYLHLTHLKIALLVNFNVPLLKNGIRRIVM
jgi:GxxExxY protein